MKILYHHRTLADGAEGIHIREMIKAFRALGHELKVVALVGENPETRGGATKRQRRWSWIGRLIPGGAYELAEIGYNFVGERSISRAIRDFQPDLIYDRYNSYCSAAVNAGNRAQIPVFLEVNAPVAYERATFDGPPLRLKRIAQRYERLICRKATHVFAVSTPLKEFLTTEREVAEEKITVLPNGADPDAFDPHLSGDEIRRRYGLANRQVIGFVGILRPWHGIDVLLTAFSRLKPHERELHLMLVGDGPIESALKEQVKQLQLTDRVTFTGRVAHADIQQHIAAMNIAVSPRATFYASPMKILEYMAMGVPVVAPRMPNIIDICQHEHDSLLFLPEDVASLESALNRLITNPADAKLLGANARKKIESHLNWKVNAKIVLELAERLRSPAIA